VILVAGFFGMVSYGQFRHDARTAAFGDALNYLRMSQETFAPVDDPFALRLLTPWLVGHVSGVSGIAPDTVWIAFTFAATTAAIVVVYEWMRGSLGVSPSTSMFAALLLSVTFYYTSYAYSNFWLVDPLNNLACALALLFAFRGRLVMFTAVILIGFLNKEAVLLMAPLYPLLAWARSGRLRDRAVWRGVGATFFIAVCYLVFRAWAQAKIGAHGTHMGADVTELARAVLSSRPGAEHLAVFGVFNFLWAVLAHGLHQRYRREGLRSDLLLATVYVFGCCLVSRAQATDTERVFIMLAPLVVGVAATVFDSWNSEPKRQGMWVLGIVYAALNFNWVTHETAVLVNLVAIAGFAFLAQQQLVRPAVAELRRQETTSLEGHSPAGPGPSVVPGSRTADRLVTYP
jgi:hypothetical protein